MLKIEEVGLRLENIKKTKEDLQNERRLLYAKIIAIDDETKALEAEEKQLSELFKEESIKQYMLEKFGVTDRDCFLAFNKKGQFEKVLRRGIDYQYNDDLVARLKKEKLYAHNVSSWFCRGDDFYDLSFAEQLKCLDWTFNKNGLLTKTDW